MQPFVEVRQVSFGYGGAPVLENVSLHLHSGQFAALVGPSGAGKTSLLRLILGSLRANSGTITIGGRRVDGSPARQVAYVPQVETVNWNFPVTVEQVVLMGRTRKSGWQPWPTAEDRRQAGSVLERLEIGELANRHIRELSGGQQQRVFLARALIAQPELLVLDEPTSGVDMRTAETVLHLLADLNRQGITILMTTHDLNAAAAHAPWVICINRSVIAQGPPELNLSGRHDRRASGWLVADSPAPAPPYAPRPVARPGARPCRRNGSRSKQTSHWRSKFPASARKGGRQ